MVWAFFFAHVHARESIVWRTFYLKKCTLLNVVTGKIGIRSVRICNKNLM